MASSSATRPCCRCAARRSANCCRRQLQLARRRSLDLRHAAGAGPDQGERRNWARITRLALTSSAWSWRPSWYRCATLEPCAGHARARRAEADSFHRSTGPRRARRARKMEVDVSYEALHDPRARSGLRHRQFSLCHTGIDEAAGRRNARRTRSLAARSARGSTGETSIRTNFSVSKSIPAPRRSPNSCYGSATCNGISAPRANPPAPSRS